LEAQAFGDEVAEAEKADGYDGERGSNGPRTTSGKGEGCGDVDCLRRGFGTMELELGDRIGRGLLFEQVPSSGEGIVQMEAAIEDLGNSIVFKQTLADLIGGDAEAESSEKKEPARVKNLGTYKQHEDERRQNDGSGDSRAFDGDDQQSTLPSGANDLLDAIGFCWHDRIIPR